LKKSILEKVHVAFWAGQEAENEFKGLGDPLKHRFLGLAHVAFWACQKAENLLEVPGDPLKHGFLVLAKSNFRATRRHTKSWQGQSTPWDTVFSTCPSCILGRPRDKKLICRERRTLE
jgi:hypothetical protein